MKSISNHLKSIEEVFLYVYIWQIPFSWRIIFDPNRSEWSESFNEYMDISIYLGEIFVFSALIIHILEYKIVNKSTILDFFSKIFEMFHVKQNKLLVLILTACIIVNVLLSIDKILSLISILHYLSFIIFLYLIFKLYVSRGTKFLYSVFLILLISLSFQFLISFAQIINQSSVGLNVLNESIISIDKENVAKFHLFSNTYIRAYGTFLHPNILAAYALSSLVFLIYAIKYHLFHVKRSFILYFLFISFLTILISQSKISIILFFIIILNFINEKIHLFHVKHLVYALLLFMVSAISFLILINDDSKQSLVTRIDQAILQSSFTKKEFLVGSGIGTYRISYDKLSSDWWNYEPIHFVPAIFFKETGIFISIIFLIIFLNTINNVPRGNIDHLAIFLIFALTIISVDHFAWDIYQGTAVILISTLALYIDKNTNKLYNIY